MDEHARQIQPRHKRAWKRRNRLVKRLDHAAKPLGCLCPMIRGEKTLTRDVIQHSRRRAPVPLVLQPFD